MDFNANAHISLFVSFSKRHENCKETRCDKT